MASPGSAEVPLARLLRAVYPARRVPAERGVRFHVGAPLDPSEDGVLLLFRLDDDGVVPSESLRPDWLAVYIGPERWVLTLIELKNDKTNGDHALKQIEQGWQWLRGELNEALPTLAPALRWQGVVLTAHNVEVPKQLIARLQRRLVVHHIQVQHAEDLRPDIVRVRPPSERREPSRHHRTPPALNAIERPLSSWDLTVQAASAERTAVRYSEKRRVLDMELAQDAGITLRPNDAALHAELLAELARLGFTLDAPTCAARLVAP